MCIAWAAAWSGCASRTRTCGRASGATKRRLGASWVFHSVHDLWRCPGSDRAARPDGVPSDSALHQGGRLVTRAHLSTTRLRAVTCQLPPPVTTGLFRPQRTPRPTAPRRRLSAGSTLFEAKWRVSRLPHRADVGPVCGGEGLNRQPHRRHGSRVQGNALRARATRAERRRWCAKRRAAHHC